MKRLILTLAIAAAIIAPMGNALHVTADNGTRQSVTHTASAAPQPIPAEVSVTVFMAYDGYQMEWDSPVAEHGEEWCPTSRCVNDTLYKIGQEWTYSVQWERV